MVRVTAALARVPVIKFRKGGLSLARPSGTTPGAATPSSSAPRPSAISPQMQSTTAMSTSSIPDIDLPVRYRRIPLSQEEIEYINGGGIV